MVVYLVDISAERLEMQPTVIYNASVLFIAALCNRAGHYILPCGFYLLFLSIYLFPRLISAVADWMTTILTHMVWP